MASTAAVPQPESTGPHGRSSGPPLLVPGLPPSRR